VFQKKVGTFQSLLRNVIIKKFLKGAMIVNPPVRSFVPTWDLPTVLKSLAKPPFEPIDSISLKMLTIKTAFLVAMASASRTCELKAFDRRPLFCTINNRGIVLRVHQSFRPKVIRPANFGKTMAFTPLVPESPELEQETRAVCVCRAVATYIKATTPIVQGNCTQFFVSFQKGKKMGKPVAKTTIAHWIKTCIYEAYLAEERDRPYVHAHSTRKQSTSWAELKNIHIQDICQQADWSTPHVFTKHYKLNLSRSVSATHANAVLTARH
jgi:hypothetical protein